MSPAAKKENKEVVLPDSQWRLSDICLYKRGFERTGKKIFTVKWLHADFLTECHLNGMKIIWM